MVQIVNWITTHVRLVIWLTILFIILSIIYSFIAKNAFIIIDPVGNAKGQKLTTYISNDAETKKVGGSGLIVVPRDTKSLIVTTGSNQKTQLPLNIPWHGFITKTVDFTISKNADKIAFSSLFTSTCVTYSPRLQSLLSYRCSRPGTIMQYQTPPTGSWRNIAVAKSMNYPNSTARPYLGGVLGISPSYPDDSEALASPLVYTADDGSATAYNLPSDLNNESVEEAVVFTNQQDPFEKRFVLVTSDGAVYLGKPGEKKGSVTYDKFPSPINYDASPHQTVCRLSGDNAYCYQGQSLSGDGDVKKTDNIITQYSFEKGIIGTAPVDKSLRLDNLYITDNGSIYAKVFKKLLRLKKVNSGYIATEIAQNIDSGSAGGSMYYVQDGDIYQVRPDDTANLVFHSDNIVSRTVFVTDGRVYILGAIKDSGDTALQAYVINGQDNTNPGKRIIDLLPTASNQLPYAVSQQLVGNKLQVGLVVAIARSPGETGTPVSEIDARKQAVLNALTTRGINTNDLSVTFTY